MLTLLLSTTMRTWFAKATLFTFLYTFLNSIVLYLSINKAHILFTWVIADRNMGPFQFCI